jgi:hypothetical protein
MADRGAITYAVSFCPPHLTPLPSSTPYGMLMSSLHGYEFKRPEGQKILFICIAQYVNKRRKRIVWHVLLLLALQRKSTQCPRAVQLPYPTHDDEEECYQLTLDRGWNARYDTPQGDSRAVCML